MTTIVKAHELTVQIKNDSDGIAAKALERYPVLSDVCLAATLLTPDQDLHAARISQLAELIDEVNPQFPGDSFTCLSLLNLLYHNSISADMYRAVLALLPDFFDLERCKIKVEGAPTLTFHGSTEDYDGFVEIVIVGGEFFGYPYTVSVSRYGNMDERKNHGDECPMYVAEEHEVDCPLLALVNSEDKPTEAQWNEAEDECDCTADDCNCDSPTLVYETRVFESDGDVNASAISDFLKEVLGRDIE